jgi:hypothetical protein
MELIGAKMVLRCGHVQPDHSNCGRRLALWTLEAAAPEEGGWRLEEKRPLDRGGDALLGQRVAYRCHPKRCGQLHTFRLEVLLPRILEGMQSGATELWIGDATTWWLA